MDTQSLPIVNFGTKYKGKSVLDFLADTDYVEWCKKQPGMLEKNPTIYNIVVNQQIMPNNQNSKTPEHNKLQNLFLDPDNLRKLRKSVFKPYLDNFEIKLNNLINDEEFIRCFGKHEIKDLMTNKNIDKTIFEDKYNWDMCNYINRYITFKEIINTKKNKEEYRKEYDIKEKEEYKNRLLLIDELLLLVNKKKEEEMVKYQEKLKKYEIDLKKYLEEKKQNQLDIEKYDKENKLYDDKLTQFKSKKERECCIELGINYDTYKNWDLGGGYSHRDSDKSHNKEEKQKISNLIYTKVKLLISSEFVKVNKKPDYVGCISMPLKPDLKTDLTIDKGDEGYELKENCKKFIDELNYYLCTGSDYLCFGSKIKEDYESKYKRDYEEIFNKCYDEYEREYYSDMKKYYTDIMNKYCLTNYKICYNEIDVDMLSSKYVLCCELKPILGDDYASVLRKMKTQISLTDNDDKNFSKSLKKIYMLIIGSFESSAASKEQLIAIFKQSNIIVKFINDILPQSIVEQFPLGQQILPDQQLLKEGKILTDNELHLQQKLSQAEEEIKQLKEQTKKLEAELVLLKNPTKPKTINDYFGKKK